MLVQRLAAFTSLAALLTGCLEARQGALDGAGDGQGDCSGNAAPAFAHVSSPVDRVAVGACGHLAFVDRAPRPTDDAWQRVVLRAPDGRELAQIPEGSGYFGALAFAPGDALFAFETFRSQLGFGDWTVIDPAAPDTPLAVSDFGAPGPFGFARDEEGPVFWHCGATAYNVQTGPLVAVSASGRRGVLAEGVHCALLTVAGARGAIVVAPVARTEYVTEVSWWDLATGASGALPVEFSAQWVYGDTVRYRHALEVSADGALVAVQPVEELYLGGPGDPIAPRVPVEVYARDGGAVVATLPGDLREAVLPAGGIVVGGEAGTTWYRAGTTGALPGARPLLAFDDADEVLVRTDDGALALLDLASSSATPIAGTTAEGGLLASTDGRVVALTEPVGGRWVIRTWRRDDGEVREVARSALAPQIHWVGASGAVVASVAEAEGARGGSRSPGGAAIGEEPTLLSADGARLWRGEGRLLDVLQEVRWGLLVSLRSANDALVAIDTSTGRARELLEGHDLMAWVDAASERLAVRYLPLSGTDSSLSFGRLQRP